MVSSLSYNFLHYPWFFNLYIVSYSSFLKKGERFFAALRMTGWGLRMTARGFTVVLRALTNCQEMDILKGHYVE